MEIKYLLKENYNEKELVVLNMGTHKFNPSCGDYNRRGGYDIYDIEDTLSDEQKLEIIDSHTDGLGTYTLKLIDKYIGDRDKGVIKRSSWGSLHMGSLKSWINRNDHRNVMTRYMTSAYGKYNMFGVWYRMTKETPMTEFGYRMLYDGEPVVRNWFHNLLDNLKVGEEKYFNDHDERQVLLRDISNLIGKLSGVYGVSIDLNKLNNKQLQNTKEMLLGVFGSAESNLQYIESLYENE